MSGSINQHVFGLRKPGAFFAAVRSRELLGTLDQGEVDGCNAILKACGNAGFPIGDTAYALATAFHETAGTMQPIREYGSDAYFTRMYDIRGRRPGLARSLGNVFAGDGILFCGRGYVQLTGRRNYEFATKRLRQLGILKQNEDLVSNPELAKRPDIAAAIMVHGMREGWFTGRDLDDDIPREGLAAHADFIASRDIINGTDKALKIATEAMSFQSALEVGAWAPIDSSNEE